MWAYICGYVVEKRMQNWNVNFVIQHWKIKMKTKLFLLFLEQSDWKVKVAENILCKALTKLL